jgi:hypothetical protein
MRVTLQVHNLESRENPGGGMGMGHGPPFTPPGPPDGVPAFTITLPEHANEAAAGTHGAVTLELP